MRDRRQQGRLELVGLGQGRGARLLLGQPRPLQRQGGLVGEGGQEELVVASEPAAARSSHDLQDADDPLAVAIGT